MTHVIMTHRTQWLHPRGEPERSKNTQPHRDCTKVHSSFMHSSQKAETAHMSADYTECMLHTIINHTQLHVTQNVCYTQLYHTEPHVMQSSCYTQSYLTQPHITQNMCYTQLYLTQNRTSYRARVTHNRISHNHMSHRTQNREVPRDGSR